MTKGTWAFGTLAFALAAFLINTGCGGKGGASGTVTSVAITPTTASVQINETQDFTAVVNLAKGSATSTSTVVTWEVNGVAGGNATTGTIVADTADVQVGVYTAPRTVPTTNNGQVNITAVAPQDPSATTTATGPTVTSNTAVVTIGVGQGLAVTTTLATVGAGGSFQFAATLNGLADTNVTWSVSSADGGTIGTIGTQSGLYMAPNFPPAGGNVTITAHDATAVAMATATAQIVYSDKSLNGPFAFSYVGNDSSGFLAAAGSFVADGNGNIVNGVEDKESFLSGVLTELPISGNYIVGADGRGSASITTTRGTDTWDFVLTTDQHAALIRFDTNFTGAGSIDEQNLNDLGTSVSLLSGPYVFALTGTDAAFHPESAGGRFTASGGNIPQTATVIDVNDNGTVISTAGGDTSLSGTYSFDTSFPGTARGTITLTSTTTGQLQFAFYLVDSTHMHVVETDRNAYLAGEVFSGASGNSFSNANLPPGNYVFTASGTSSASAYALGGVFASSGGGSVTGGATDKNAGGTVASNAALGSCAYAVNSTNSRIDLKLYVGSNSCPATPAASVYEFAAYPTAQGSALLVELDAAGVSVGSAFFQQSATATLSGSFAVALGGQGAFHNSPASIQQDAIGQVRLAGTSVTSGNLNVNTYNAVFPQSDPLSTTLSLLTAPGTNGRGTLTLAGTDPSVTYNLVYYLINGSTALLFDSNTTLVNIGVLADQF